MRRMACFGAATVALAMPALAQDDDGWASAAKVAAARSAAPTIVVAFMDSVRQPRGSWGTCPADGKVIILERGQLGHGGDRVSVGVPCATLPRDLPHLSEPVRHIPMRFLHSRTFARLYFDQRGRLVDYEALRLGPEPLPPGW